jgi:hypothetical protein
MKDDDDFQKLLTNTMLYGTGVMTMTHNGAGALTVRVVPIEEYAQTAEQLKWVDQNTKEARK